jgi:hypothetical protein
MKIKGLFLDMIIPISKAKILFINSYEPIKAVFE